MAVSLDFKTISQVYVYQLKEVCLLEDLNNDCTKYLPQYHQWPIISRSFLYRTLLTHTALCSGWLNKQGLFSSVINGWLYQDHLPSITVLTLRALCSQGPEQLMCRISFPSVNHWVAFLFMTIFWVELYWLESSLSLETIIINVLSLP